MVQGGDSSQNQITNGFFFSLSLDKTPRAWPLTIISQAKKKKKVHFPANMADDKTTMKAVVFDGPHKVSIQDRPIPKCTLSSLQCTHFDDSGGQVFIHRGH